MERNRETIGQVLYLHSGSYTLDRFHVARELQCFLGHLPKTWQAVCHALTSFDTDTLLTTVDSVPEEKIPEAQRNEWRKYVAYLRGHQTQLMDYREVFYDRHASNG